MSPADAPETRFCSECGQQRPMSEFAHFGDRLVCPNCKNSYAQKLREGVAPAMTVEYGGFWIRFVAALIDGVILYVADRVFDFAVLGRSAAQIRPNPANPLDPALLASFGLIWLVSMASAVAYETFFVGKMGATPGKMAVGLKVVRPDGSPVSYGRAAGRYFAKILSAIILMIGYIMAGFDSQKRALHDMICDTRVIKSRA